MDQGETRSTAVSTARPPESGFGGRVGWPDLQHSAMDPALLAAEAGARQQLNLNRKRQKHDLKAKNSRAKQRREPVLVAVRTEARLRRRMKQFGFSSFADVRITSLDLNAQLKNDFFTASEALPLWDSVMVALHRRG